MGNFKIKPMFGGASSGYAKSSPGQSNEAGLREDMTVNPITGNIDQNPTKNVGTGNNAIKINLEPGTPGTENYDQAIIDNGSTILDRPATPEERRIANERIADGKAKDVAAAKESNILAKEKEAERLAEENKNKGKGQTISKKARGKTSVLSKSQNMADNARVKKDANQNKRLDMKIHMEAYDKEIHGTDKNAYRKEGKKVARDKALTHRSEALKRKMAKEIFVGGQKPDSVVDTQEDMNASNTDATLINAAEITTANTEKEEVKVVEEAPRAKIDKKKFKETKVGKVVSGLFKKNEEKKKARQEKRKTNKEARLAKKKK